MVSVQMKSPLLLHVAMMPPGVAAGADAGAALPLLALAEGIVLRADASAAASCASCFFWSSGDREHPVRRASSRGNAKEIGRMVVIGFPPFR
jgi:hypothetical protein